MIYLSIICFAIAALIGLVLVSMYSRGKLTVGGALLHGLFAAIGLILLIIMAVKGQTTTAMNYALILFIIAAIGGAVLFLSHLTKGVLPKPLLAIHPIIAIIGFITLLAGAFKH